MTGTQLAKVFREAQLRLWSGYAKDDLGWRTTAAAIWNAANQLNRDPREALLFFGYFIGIDPNAFWEKSDRASPERSMRDIQAGRYMQLCLAELLAKEQGDKEWVRPE